MHLQSRWIRGGLLIDRRDVDRCAAWGCIRSGALVTSHVGCVGKVVRDGGHGRITVHRTVGESEDTGGKEMKNGDEGSVHSGNIDSLLMD